MKAEFRLVIIDHDAAEKDRFYLMVAKPHGKFQGAILEFREPYSGDWREVTIVEPYVRKNV